MSSFFRDRVGLVQPMKIRDFRLLWTGMFVSMVGDGFYYVAVAWQVYDLSNSPAALAGVGIAWSLPQVAVVPLAGVLADRVDRRFLMIAADVVRAAAIGTVGVLSIMGVLTLPMLVGLVVLFGAGQAMFHPAFHSIVPEIVPPDMLVRANAVDQFVRPFALMVVGPVIGGQLVEHAGSGWAFVADAGTFLWSATMVAMIRPRPRRERDEHVSALQEALEGLRFVRRTRWLLITMCASVLSLFAVWGPWETLMPFVVRNDLGGSASDLSWVYFSGGVGAVLVAVTLGQRGALPRRAMTVLYLVWASGMFGTALFGVARTQWHARFAGFVTEASIAALIVLWYSILQRLVPSHLLGRVTSLDWMITLAGVPLSFAAVGPLAGAIGADATLILAGLVGGGVTLLFMFIPGARRPEHDGSLRDVAEGDEPVPNRSPALP
ncbi:MAG TPA: MFS transporter [Actinomycetota bacterium]|nr:MFS transporter [Actinomycetota bacterium]